MKLCTLFATKKQQDKIVLDSGGYHTLTTKLRMNQASNQYMLGYVVFQKDYGWYVEHNGSTVDFYDGMELPRD